MEPPPASDFTFRIDSGLSLKADTGRPTAAPTADINNTPIFASRNRDLDNDEIGLQPSEVKRRVYFAPVEIWPRSDEEYRYRALI
jgi:hypothetical protein